MQHTEFSGLLFCPVERFQKGEGSCVNETIERFQNAISWLALSFSQIFNPTLGINSCIILTSILVKYLFFLPRAILPLLKSGSRNYLLLSLVILCPFFFRVFFFFPENPSSRLTGHLDPNLYLSQCIQLFYNSVFPSEKLQVINRTPFCDHTAQGAAFPMLPPSVTEHPLLFIFSSVTIVSPLCLSLHCFRSRYEILPHSF